MRPTPSRPPRPCAGRLACGFRALAGALRPGRHACGLRASRGTALARRARGLARQGGAGRRRTAFTFQDGSRRARTRCRARLSRRAACQLASGLAACRPGRGARLRGRELHAGAPRLGQPDRDRLLGRLRAVLAFPDVLDLLAHELARLRAGRFSLARVLPRTLHDLLLWHGVLPVGVSAVMLEVLDRALVLLGGGARLERTEILPRAGLPARLLRVEPVLAGLELPDHVPLLFQSNVSTSTDTISADSPASCTAKPATCPYSHRPRSACHSAGSRSGAVCNASATRALIGATTTSHTTNPSASAAVPASVQRKLRRRRRTSTASVPAARIDPI